VTTHPRKTPLLSVLARLGWQRDQNLWTVRCRDGHGRRARILVHLSATGVCLTVPDLGPLQLNVPQAWQLRAALRDAFLSLDQLAGPDGLDEPRRVAPAAPPPARPPSYRERVPYTIPARPSVAEIAARLTNP